MFDYTQVSSTIEAYLLGFLYADGYITNKVGCKYYTLGIAVSEKDKDFLQKIVDIFNMSLQKEYKLKYQADTKSYRIAIGDIELIDRLQDLGIVSHKSYDTSPFIFNNVPDKYKKDFLLGLWDGDGSFAISHSDRHRNLAGLISNNENLLQAIAEYLNSQLGKDFCHVKPRTDGDPYPRIRLVDNKAKIFGDWLYQNPVSCKLQRKYDIYIQFKPIRGKGRSGFENKGAKGILCLDNNKVYATAKECCTEEFGIDNPGAVNGIRAACRGEQSQARGKHFRYLTEKERENYIKYGSI